MWVVPVVPWVEVLRWRTGGTSGWVEVLGSWVEEVLVVGAHYGGWKDARTIYAD